MRWSPADLDHMLELFRRLTRVASCNASTPAPWAVPGSGRPACIHRRGEGVIGWLGFVHKASIPDATLPSRRSTALRSGTCAVGDHLLTFRLRLECQNRSAQTANAETGRPARPGSRHRAVRSAFSANNTRKRGLVGLAAAFPGSRRFRSRGASALSAILKFSAGRAGSGAAQYFSAGINCGRSPCCPSRCGMFAIGAGFAAEWNKVVPGTATAVTTAPIR